MQNIKRNIIPIIFTAFYVILLALDITFDVSFFGNFQYAINSLFVYLLPLICPVLALVFFLCENKEFALKKWLLPVALGATVISSVFSLYSTFSLLCSNPFQIDLQIRFPMHILEVLAAIIAFVGTLFNLKYVSLLKYGALSIAVLNIVEKMLVISTVNFNSYVTHIIYQSKYLFGEIRFLAFIIFYLGIFIYTFNYKCNNLSNKSKGE